MGDRGTGPWADGLTSPIPGEEVSGDRWAVRELDGRRQVMLCDGLGHGSAAAAASRAAIDAFLVAPCRARAPPWITFTNPWRVRAAASSRSPN
ncbi:hypothetical protein ACFQX7_34695 [Luedemannella flava]